MNPNTFRLRVNAEDGRIWLTREQRQKPINRIKDMTDEILWTLCADVTADPEERPVVREVKFAEPGGKPWVMKITVEKVEEQTNGEE